jgi:hypothetical protein
MTVETNTTTGGGDTNYTHRDWKHATGQVLLVVAAGVKALEQMLASLADVHAGKTHMEHVQACMTTGTELLASGLELVDSTDARYLPVHEAIQAAGGKDEVAHTKTYHQT